MSSMAKEPLVAHGIEASPSVTSLNSQRLMKASPQKARKQLQKSESEGFRNNARAIKARGMSQKSGW